jgi:hypothetical protein
MTISMAVILAARSGSTAKTERYFCAIRVVENILSAMKFTPAAQGTIDPILPLAKVRVVATDLPSLRPAASISYRMVQASLSPY